MNRFDLIQQIKRRSVRYGDFVLKSGQKSLFYMDLRTVTLSSLLPHLVSEIEYKLAGEKFEAIGGPALGACPLVSGFVYAVANTMPDLRAFYVRPEQKEHGMKGLIMGSVRKGDRVVVVEDVTTTAGSLIRAIEAIKEFGCHPVKAVTLVDRSVSAHAARGWAWLEEKELCSLSSVFTMKDFGFESYQTITREYLNGALDLANEVVLEGDPWSWTEPDSIGSILRLAQVDPAMAPIMDRLIVYRENDTPVKISIRSDVFVGS